MKLGKAIAAASILGAATLGLTACDPPMPPEVAAALAEQTYTCIEGDTAVAAPTAMADLMWGWSDSLTYACVDPEPVMTISTAENIESAQVELTEYASQCSPVASVPFAVEASVLVYMQSEVSSLSLSPKSMAGILDGSITNWNQLNEDNPGYEMPDFPLTVLKQTDTQAFKAMQNYLSTKKINLKQSSNLELVDAPNMESYYEMTEGQVALVPNSYAVMLGLYPASIYLGLDADEYPILANPDVAGIQSGSTQWLMTKTTDSVTVKLDPKKTPLAPEGSDEAPLPYQAIYPVNLNICDSDSLLARAASRYLLRLDSQGSLAASNYAPLPEAVRVEALLSISKGLPAPKPVQ